MHMLALTLRHPWPFAIVHMGKTVENRSWVPFNNQLRKGDRFAIHGGKVPAASTKLADIQAVFKELCGKHGTPEYRVNGDLTLREVMMPGIVAVVTYGGSVKESTNPWFDGEGYGWLLSDVIVLPNPIPATGFQGLWTLTAEQEKQVRKQAGIE